MSYRVIHVADIDAGYAQLTHEGSEVAARTKSRNPAKLKKRLICIVRKGKKCSKIVVILVV